MVVYFNPTADDLHLHPIPNIVLRTSEPRFQTLDKLSAKY